jgi:predicted nucleic acid-binding protein
MITTNYVVVESLAVARGRLGAGAVRAMIEEIFPLLRVEWIDEDAHRSATAALLAADRGGVSIVDLTSFEIMRRQGLRSAFTFDRHFRQYGFETVPASPGPSRHG